MKAPEQAAPDLVGRVVVRVVHVRPGRARHELVGEARARLDRLLGDVRHAVHRVRQLLAVEMDAGRLVHVVLERRADRVALDDRQSRTRPRPVESEGLDGVLLRIDAVVHLLDRELEDLHAVHDRRFERLVAVALDLGGLAAEEPVDGSLRRRVVVDRCTRWRRGRRRGGLMRRVVGGRDRGRLAGGRRRRRRGGRGRRPVDPAGRRSGRGWRAGGDGRGDETSAGQGAGAQQAAAGHRAVERKGGARGGRFGCGLHIHGLSIRLVRAGVHMPVGPFVVGHEAGRGLAFEAVPVAS